MHWPLNLYYCCNRMSRIRSFALCLQYIYLFLFLDLSPSLFIFSYYSLFFSLLSFLSDSASHQSQQCLLSMKYLVWGGLCAHIADFISPWNNRWYVCPCGVCLDWFRCSTLMPTILIGSNAISVIGLGYYRFTSQLSSEIWHGCQHVINMPGGVKCVGNGYCRATPMNCTEIKMHGAKHE